MQAATRTVCFVFPSLTRPTRIGGCVLSLLGLALVLPGCSKASKPQPSADVAAAAEEEKPAVPAQPAAKVDNKADAAKGAEAKPAEAPLRHLPSDITKWEFDDLKASLSTRDFRFLIAVVVYSSRNVGAKRARELRSLLETAGKMRDDATVILPLPPIASPVTASKPVVPGPAAAPPTQTTAADSAGKPARRQPRRFGGSPLNR